MEGRQEKTGTDGRKKKRSEERTGNRRNEVSRYKGWRKGMMGDTDKNKVRTMKG